ncbi:SMI1/KNR4 family protein [Archangium sp.]|uniref:SMI1/KNR4 family protein n=1 Tax=Archangium sp. TaxID=1872627 RepID=UPI002D5402AD|nr:SMI1/KNR4 family protein [Archangium sp.]HYO52634.1 SMI1/KNR4 family protein [Archangium sp.]
MSVSWKPYVRPSPSGVEPLALELLESQWGVTLPDAYKHVVSKYQGMTPSPSSFDMGKGQNTFSVLLTLTRDDRWDEYSVSSAYESLSRYMPPGIYPFGLTSGGESLCFDYRESPSQPRVALVTVEGDIHPIAGSFADFMARLHN